MLEYWKYHVCVYENSEVYKKQIEEYKRYSCNKIINFRGLIIVLIPYGEWYTKGIKQGDWQINQDKIEWKYISQEFKKKYKNIRITTQYLRGVLNA